VLLGRGFFASALAACHARNSHTFAETLIIATQKIESGI
jgi:hypothetical protein